MRKSLGLHIRLLPVRDEVESIELRTSLTVIGVKVSEMKCTNRRRGGSENALSLFSFYTVLTTLL